MLTKEHLDDRIDIVRNRVLHHNDSITNLVMRVAHLESQMETHLHPQKELKKVFEVFLSSGSITKVKAHDVTESDNFTFFNDFEGNNVAAFRTEDVLGWNRATMSGD